MKILGSPQILKLYSKFNPQLVNQLAHQRKMLNGRFVRLPRYQLPRQCGRTDKPVQCAVDLTGDGDLVEDFSFIYVKGM